MQRLTLEAASIVVDEALAEARRRGLQPMCVAVLDAGGHVLALKRETDAGLLRPQIASAKASGALGFGFDSREIGRRAAQAPAFFAAVSTLGPVVPSAGGVLIRSEDGVVVGAVGVSGDKPDEDEACAMAGLKAAGLAAGPPLRSDRMKLRSIELNLPAPREAARFLTAIWGMAPAQEKDGVLYLRGTGEEAYLVALAETEAPTIRSVTFTGDEAEVAAIADRAAANGAPRRHVTSTDPGGGDGVEVQMPEGEIIRFLAGGEAAQAQPPGPDTPVKLTHVVLNSADAEATADFSEKVFGFRVSDRTKGMVFVRCCRAHHSIAFARAGHTSLNHIAFEMTGVDAVMRGIGRLRDAGLSPSWGPGRHGPGANVFAYFIAPFGAVVEFSTAVEEVGEDYRTGAPEDWTWPPNRIDQWGVSAKDVEALSAAERTFRFAPFAAA